MHMTLMVSEYTDFLCGPSATAQKYLGRDSCAGRQICRNAAQFRSANRSRISVVVCRHDIHRPNGPIQAPDADVPSFAPSKTRFGISSLKMGAIRRPRLVNLAPRSRVDQADAMILCYVLTE